MRRFLYPQNLTAKASLWLWGMRDFVILAILALPAVGAFVQFGWLIPAAATLCFGFLTIRKEDLTILDFIRYAVRYFITAQQWPEDVYPCSGVLRTNANKEKRLIPRRSSAIL